MDQVEALRQRDIEALRRFVKDMPLAEVFRDCLDDLTQYCNTLNSTTERRKMLAVIAYSMSKAQLENRAANDRRRELEIRVADLEQNQTTYRGTWMPNTAYGKGTLITDHGSLWFCKNATCDRPGKSENWKLMAKRGNRNEHTD